MAGVSDAPGPFLPVLPVPVLLIRADSGEIEYANPASFEYLAVGRDQLRSVVDNPVRLFREQDMIRALAAVQERGLPAHIESLHSVSGLGYDLECDVYLDPQPGGLTLVLLQPLRHQSVEGLSADEDRDQLEIIYRGLVHEVNNPLGGIRGTAQLLLQGAVAENQREAFLQGIVNDVDRIQKILRAFGHTAFASAPADEVVALPQLLESIIRNVEAGCKRNLTFVMRVDLGMPDFHTDCRKLEQILFNLILNASSFTGPDGRIRISAAVFRRALREVGDDRRWIRISVEDSGIGVVGLEHKLFTPFYSTRAGGSGLGLALSRGFARQLEGDLKALTSDMGGACFELDIPVRFAV